MSDQIFAQLKNIPYYYNNIKSFLSLNEVILMFKTSIAAETSNEAILMSKIFLSLLEQRTKLF